MTQFEAAQNIAQRLYDAKHRRTYAVGSFCVYYLLWKPSKSDMDLCSDARPDEIREVCKVVSKHGEAFGTLIVKEGEHTFEITTFRKDMGVHDKRHPKRVRFTQSLTKDSARRDLTVNAIYYDVLNNTFIDPQNGKADLQNGVVRFIWDADTRINEDLLRVLRYVRFKHRYELSDASLEYSDIVRNRMPELLKLPVERIKQELDAILLDTKHNTKALDELMDLGFFAIFIPQMQELVTTPGGPPYHMEGDVWVHTKMVLFQMNKLCPQDVYMLWAALLHDIAKAYCYTEDYDGTPHYYGHDAKGAETALDIMRYLKFPKKQMQRIEWLVQNHLRVSQITKMRKLKAYHFMLHPYFKDLLCLNTADDLGRIADANAYQPKEQSLWDYYRAFMKVYESIRFYTGADIQKKYPDLSGKQIGEKLERKNEEVLQNIDF